MKVKPWMYGVGVLGVAGVGIALYEVTKKKAAAPAAAPPSTDAAIASGAIPTIPVARPRIAAPGPSLHNRPRSGLSFTRNRALQ